MALAAMSRRRAHGHFARHFGYRMPFIFYQYLLFDLLAAIVSIRRRHLLTTLVTLGRRGRRTTTRRAARAP